MREVERKSKDKYVSLRLKRPLAGPLNEDLRETSQHGGSRWDRVLYASTAAMAKTIQELIMAFLKISTSAATVAL